MMFFLVGKLMSLILVLVLVDYHRHTVILAP
jgi:hypothetical protein